MRFHAKRGPFLDRLADRDNLFHLAHEFESRLGFHRIPRPTRQRDFEKRPQTLDQ
jgi:hypothetical protein